jgi:hypothetical protein
LLHDAELKLAVQRSGRLSEALQTILETDAVVDTRGRFALAYLTLSLDHREAILLLVNCGAFASATALQRPLLEAFVTGVWIDSSATEAEVGSIASLQIPPPKFETMVKRLRKTHSLGKWFEVMRGHYNILSDYAHGHRRQLSRWLTQASVEPRYTHAQMAETLRYADIVGTMAAIHREKISKRPTDQLLRVFDSIMRKNEYPV